MKRASARRQRQRRRERGKNASDALMRAVAERLVGARFAAAKPDLLAFSGGEFLWRQADGLVRAVAERLIGTATARAPPIILAGLDIDAVGGLLRGDRFGHCSLFLQIRFRFNVAFNSIFDRRVRDKADVTESSNTRWRFTPTSPTTNWRRSCATTRWATSSRARASPKVSKIPISCCAPRPASIS